MKVLVIGAGGREHADRAQPIGVAHQRVVADLLDVPKTSVRVLRGETSRHKTLALDLLDDETLRARIRAADR